MTTTERTISAAETPARARDRAQDASCAHCSLPVPRALVVEGADLQFCCAGCRTVHEVIHSCGLERYYRLRESTDQSAAPARTTDRGYGEFDDPAFRNLYARAEQGGLFSAELYLEGVHCAACVWLVERLPRILPGLIEARLDMRRSLVRVVWDERAVPLSRIARSLDSLGYPPHPARDVDARAIRRLEDRRALIRIGVAGAIAGNIMLIAVAMYAGAFSGMDADHRSYFRFLSAALGILSLVWPGAVFFRSAIAALRTRTLHLDVPIAVGLGVGAASGLINTLRGAGEIYFDSLSVLVFLLLVGRWVQQRQQRWASDSVELLFSLTPTSARRIESGEVREVPIESLAPSDLVEVIAGESIPADGVVEQGESSIDQSLLTGESRAVEASPGSIVAAGAVNLGAAIRVRVEAAGEQTRIAGLMRMVEEGARRRAPIVHAADRIAGWFVATALMLATLTLAGWLMIEPSRAVDNAVALLIVTCPCALGLATPLAIAVAIGRAAGRGILIKGGDALERLTRPGLILLDKTGTITEGRTAMVEWAGDRAVQPLVAAVERHSSHPAARALAAACDNGGEALHAHDVRQTLGGGVEGVVGGTRIIVGTRAHIAASGASIPEWAEACEASLAARALSPALVAKDGRVVSIAGLGDPIRADASDSIERLRQMGWRVGVLSGDHPDVVAGVASELGLDPMLCEGGADPERKVARVERAARLGPVVMVGDGVNDAPALAAASVGVAVHGGAEASLAAADVSISRAGLAPVVELIDGSRGALSAVHRNLRVSLLYNCVCGALAVTGVINPLIAAVLMPLSSITVISMSWKAKTFQK